MEPQFSIIIGQTLNSVIEGVRSPEDLRHFKRVASYTPCGRPNLLICGRKTFESMPDLRSETRQVCVLTRTVPSTTTSGHHCFSSVAAILQYCANHRQEYYKLFVIGGAEIYAEFERNINEIFQTVFDTTIDTPNAVKYAVNTSAFMLVQEYAKNVTLNGAPVCAHFKHWTREQCN